MAPSSAPDSTSDGELPFGKDEMSNLLRRAGIHVPAAANDAIGFVFRIGGVSALVAAWLCWQMRKRRKAVVDCM